jgi:3-phenylpropionate/cinnamic acid dioxygenase small subunit
MDPRLEDRLVIEETLARYVHAIDDGDAAAWAALFTPDGSLQVRDKAAVTGTDALQAMVHQLHKRLDDRLRHSITNVIVDEIRTDGSAHVRAYGLVTEWGDSPVLSNFAVYDIDMIREDPRWKFRVIRVRLLGEK